jgi:cupin 2 domain-containing protein
VTAAAGNIFADVRRELAEEEVLELLAMPSVRIERIVSTGQTTPQGDWLEQDWDEWVIVLEGSARLRIAGEDAPRLMTRGDFLHIPKHARHRVEWTDPDQPTVWLAIHCR